MPKRKIAKKSVSMKARAGGGGVKLDAAAQDWLALLSDPCSAKLVSPCYESAGTGLVTRVHDVISPNATAVDYVYEFTPSLGADIAHRFGWSTTRNGSLGNAGIISVGGLLGTTVVGRARCVAACVRVVYTGAELDRKGVVAATLDSGFTLIPAEGIAWTALEMASNFPKVVRLGSTVHEYRWCPGDGDGDFRSPSFGGEEGATGSSAGNSISLAISGVHPGEFYLDVISCWEWQPSQEGTKGSVSIMKNPPSNNTFNQIVRGLGDLGRWATHEGREMVGMMGSYASTAARVGAMFL